jgi:hypothetical protein
MWVIFPLYGNIENYIQNFISFIKCYYNKEALYDSQTPLNNSQTQLDNLFNSFESHASSHNSESINLENIAYELALNLNITDPRTFVNSENSKKKSNYNEIKEFYRDIKDFPSFLEILKELNLRNTLSYLVQDFLIARQNAADYAPFTENEKENLGAIIRIFINGKHHTNEEIQNFLKSFFVTSKIWIFQEMIIKRIKNEKESNFETIKNNLSPLLDAIQSVYISKNINSLINIDLLIGIFAPSQNFCTPDKTIITLSSNTRSHNLLTPDQIERKKSVYEDILKQTKNSAIIEAAQQSLSEIKSQEIRIEQKNQNASHENNDEQSIKKNKRHNKSKTNIGINQKEIKLFQEKITEFKKMLEESQKKYNSAKQSPMSYQRPKISSQSVEKGSEHNSINFAHKNHFFSEKKPGKSHQIQSLSPVQINLLCQINNNDSHEKNKLRNARMKNKSSPFKSAEKINNTQNKSQLPSPKNILPALSQQYLPQSNHERISQAPHFHVSSQRHIQQNHEPFSQAAHFPFSSQRELKNQPENPSEQQSEIHFPVAFQNTALFSQSMQKAFQKKSPFRQDLLKNNPPVKPHGASVHKNPYLTPPTTITLSTECEMAPKKNPPPKELDYTNVKKDFFQTHLKNSSDDPPPQETIFGYERIKKNFSHE